MTKQKRRAQLSEKQKRRIIRWHNKKKKSISDIATHFDRSKQTIRNTINAHRNLGDVVLKRKTKLTSEDRERILALVQRERTIRAEGIRTELKLSHVHVDTICRLLRDEGLGCRGSKKHPCRKSSSSSEEEEEEDSDA